MNVTNRFSRKYAALTGLLFALSFALGASHLQAQNGLRGDYFEDLDFRTPTVSQVDTVVNFNWGGITPSGLISGNNFSVRWTGTLTAPETGTFIFESNSDDWARLYLDGNFVTFSSNGLGSQSIILEAGRTYDVLYEYEQHGGGSFARLRWSGPSFPLEVVGSPGPRANVLSPVRSAANRLLIPTFASANFSQSGHPALQSILRNFSGTGWAIWGFLTQEPEIYWELPEAVPAGTLVELNLHQIYGHSHMLGKFRLASTPDAVSNTGSAWSNVTAYEYLKTNNRVVLSEETGGNIFAQNAVGELTSVYRIAFTTTQVTRGIRLKSLRDNRLPSSGPGLASNGNFVLNEVELRTLGYIPELATFSISPGIYKTPIQVSLIPPIPGTTLRYTLDGTEPAPSSPAYSTPITVSQSLTLKVLAFRDGLLPSATATAQYVIDPSVPIPVSDLILWLKADELAPVGIFKKIEDGLNRASDLTVTQSSVINKPFLNAKLPVPLQPVQGPVWFYKTYNGSLYADLAYNSSAKLWQGNAGGIWKDSQLHMHPGSSLDMVLVWKSPGDYTIRIQGNAERGDYGGGDGVTLLVKKNGSTLGSGLVNNATPDYSFDFQNVQVQTGDEIRFHVNRNGAYFYDTTRVQPVITITAGGSGVFHPLYENTTVTNKPVLSFDGQEDFMSVGGMNSDFDNGITAFFRARFSSEGTRANERLFDFGYDDGSDNIVFYRHADGNINDLYFYVSKNRSGQWIGAPNVLGDKGIHNFCVIQPASGPTKIFVDGVEKASGSVHLPRPVSRPKSYIGKSNWAGVPFFSGEISEVIIYNRGLSDTERQEVEAYFVASYTESAATPQSSLPPGVYEATQNVSLTTATSGASIRYTLNGNLPTESSTLFSGPVSISAEGTTTLKARAFKVGSNPSGVLTASYTIDTGGPVLSNIQYGSSALSNGLNITSANSISLNATDTVGISRVEFYVNGQLIGTDTNPDGGFSTPWNLSGLQANGSYTIMIRAYDSRNTLTEQSYNVSLALAPPSAPALTSPASGTTSADSNIIVQGTSLRNTFINLYRGTTPLASAIPVDSAGQFQASVSLVSGLNSITAKATYRPGEESAASSARTITLDSTLPKPPVGIQIQSREGSALRLDWTPPADSVVTGYRIYRAQVPFSSKTGSGVQRLQSSAQNLTQTTYSDFTANETTYYYRLVSVNSAGTESALSDQVSAISDASGPTAAISYQTNGSFDATSPGYGLGTVTATIVSSEPLQAAPFLSLRPAGGTPVPVALSAVIGQANTWQGTFTIATSTPTGAAAALFSARDIAGNRGSFLTSGSMLNVDTKGPRLVEHSLSGSIKNDSAVTLNFSITLDENPVNGAGEVVAPVLKYSLSSTVPTPGNVTTGGGSITQGTDARNWNVTLPLPAAAGLVGSEILSFTFEARDRLGNLSTEILPQTSFEVYQGSLPALAAPFGISATPEMAGAIRIQWQSVPDAVDYEVYRGSDVSSLAVIGRSGNQTSYADITPSDGDYVYAVKAVRQANSQESLSSFSEPILATSDRAATGTPLNLVLALSGQGLQISWAEPAALTETVSYEIYRSATAITSLSSLAPLNQHTVLTPQFVDPAPSASQQYYAVVARDAAGNRSLPLAGHINIDLLPVSSLTVTRNGTVNPVISWTPVSGSVSGYHLYEGEGTDQGQWTRLNASLLTGSSFTDTGYTPGQDRRYIIVTLDASSNTSPPRDLRLPDLSLQPAGDLIIRKGLANRLYFNVTNNSAKAITNARLSLTLAGRPHVSSTFNVPIGTTVEVSLTVGGYSELSAGNLTLNAAMEIRPHAGELVSVITPVPAQVQNQALNIELLASNFTRGGSGQLKFHLDNPGLEEIEFVTALQNGAQASPDIHVLLSDTSGNLLAEVPVKLGLGMGVVNLPDGSSVARIPGGGSYTSEAITVPLASDLPNEILVSLQINRSYFHKGQPDQIEIVSLLAARKAVNTVATSYSAQVTSVTPAASTGAEAIHISGLAAYRSGGAPAVSVPVRLKISRDGFELSESLVTVANGTFAHTIQPSALRLPGGVYQVWAIHPDMTEKPQETASFTVTSLSARPSRYEARMPRNYAQDLPIRISAGLGTMAQNLRLEALAADQPGGSLPVGFQVNLPSPLSTLAAGASTTLTAQVIGSSAAAETGSLVLRVSSDENPSGWQKVTVVWQLTNATPALRSSPTLLQVGLAPGGSETTSLRLENSGFMDLENARVRLVDLQGQAAPSWLKLGTDSSLGRIAVGAQVEVPVLVAPPAAAALGDFTYYLRVEGDNMSPASFPVQIALTESGQGNLYLRLVDAFSTDASSSSAGETSATLQNIPVTVTNEQTPSVEFLVKTDQYGELLLQDLPAGLYKVKVSSPKHNSYTGRFWVRAGLTSSGVIPLQYGAVTVQWEVVETRIKDVYEVLLQTEFETDLPLASVVLEPGVINLIPMQQGEVYQGEFTATNYGGINAENVKFTPPPTDQWFRYELLSEMPDTLAPGEQVRIPFKISCIKTVPSAISVAMSNAGENSREMLAQKNGSDSKGIVPVGGIASAFCFQVNYFLSYDSHCSNGLDYSDYSSAVVSSKHGECGYAESFRLTYAPQSQGGLSTSTIVSILQDKAVSEIKCWIKVYTDCIKRLIKFFTGSWVNVLLREYEDEITDLNIKLPNGDLSVQRQYWGHAWHWNDFLEPLSFKLDTEGRQIIQITRLRVPYPATDSARTLFKHGSHKITRTSQGYKWTDSSGEWRRYNLEGKPVAIGTRQQTLATFVYDGAGKLVRVNNVNNTQVLWFEYQGNTLSAIRDAANRRVEYAFSGQNLTRVTDPLGQETAYLYDGQNRMTRKTNPDGGVFNIAYNAGGDVASVLDGSGVGHFFEYNYNSATKEYYVQTRSTGGQVRELFFDREGNPHEARINGEVAFRLSRDLRAEIITDGRGKTTRMDYNEFGRMVNLTRPDGSKVSFAHSTTYNQPSRIVDAEGKVLELDYDSGGNPTEIRHGGDVPEEQRITMTYDAMERLSSMTLHGNVPAQSATFDVVYDAQGNINTVTDALDGVLTYSNYDAEGNPGTVRDRRGKDWQFAYDVKGRPLTITSPLNFTEQYEYDAMGNISALIDAKNKRTEFFYDHHQNLVRIVDPLGNEQNITYNSDNRPILHRDRQGRENTFAYDTIGRIKAAIDGAGNQTSWDYLNNDIGRDFISGIQHPTYKEEFEYDLQGRVAKLREVLGAQTNYLTRFEYDKNGLPSRITDPENRTTNFSYDALNRLKQETDPAGGNTTYRYDKRGNLAESTDARGNSWHFEYDLHGRIVRETLPGGEETKFAYDGEDNLTSVIDAKGQKITYTYDNDGRMTHVKHFAAGNYSTAVYTASFTLDQRGDVTAYNDGTSSGSFAYDDLGRKTSESITYDLGGTPFTKSHSYTYDKDGYKTGFTAPGGNTTTVSYDQAGRPVVMHLPAQAGAITVNSYYENRPSLVTLPGGSNISRTYDPLMRSQSIEAKTSTQNPLLNLGYTYTPASNVSSIEEGATPVNTARTKNYAYDARDWVVSAPEGAYSYDSMGNRLTGPGSLLPASYNVNNRLTADGRYSYQYDANGALISRSTLATGLIWFYDYDIAGRLIEVRRSDTGLVARYSYDPWNRRIQKLVASTSTAPAVTTWFHYADEGLVAEFDAAGQEARAYGYWLGKQWGTDPVFLRTFDQGQSTWSFYLNDHAGTPQRLVNSSGDIVWSASHDTYGKALVGEQSSVVNNLRFPGQYFDAETGFHYNWNRYYDPDTGRYISSDPAQDGKNFYIYGLNNPMKYTDPEGLYVHAILAVLVVLDIVRDLCEGNYKTAAVKIGFIGLIGGGVTISKILTRVRAASKAAKAAKSVKPGQTMSSYPQGRVVGGKGESPRLSDPPAGMKESSAWDPTPDNLALMERGRPPVGRDSLPVELHHRNQSPAGPLDQMTSTTHDNIPHPISPSQINRSQFGGERGRYWRGEARTLNGQ